MPKNGGRSRAALLDIAAAKMLGNGFAAVSLREIAEAGALTKGGVSHHFADKDQLARALIERAIADDLEIMDALAECAKRRSRDPLRRMALFLRGLEDCVARLRPEGSLRAALAYQNMALSAETSLVLGRSFKRITVFYAELFAEILDSHRPQVAANPMALAETLSSILEGAVLLARAQNDPKLAARPIAVFRKTLEALFAKPSARGRSTAPKGLSRPARRPRR